MLRLGLTAAPRIGMNTALEMRVIGQFMSGLLNSVYLSY